VKSGRIGGKGRSKPEVERGRPVLPGPGRQEGQVRGEGLSPKEEKGSYKGALARGLLGGNVVSGRGRRSGRENGLRVPP